MPAPTRIIRLRSPLTGRFIASPGRQFDYTFKGSGVSVTLQTPAVRLWNQDFTKLQAKEAAEAVQAAAKANVAPGVGPGPHPHRTDHGWVWEDTGNLGDAIYWAWDADKKWSGDPSMYVAVVGVDATIAPYGMWLEWGFHGPSGRFYVYPFIGPAFYDTLGDWKGAMVLPGVSP